MEALYRAQLVHVIKNTPLLAILYRLRQLNPKLYLAAGALRNTVWNALHAIEPIMDNIELDVVYFNVEELGQSLEQ